MAACSTAAGMRRMVPARAFYGGAGSTCRRLSSPLRSSSHARGPVPHHATVLEETSLPGPDSSSSITVEQVAYKDGAFTATGCLLTCADPDVVYRVLTDYGELSRIFRNVVSSKLELHPFTSAKQLVQECRWQFLLFQGTFRSVFEVAEDPAARSLAFNANSAFMRRFVGRWEVLPQPGGGAAVRHHLCVEPSLKPPQRVGNLSKRIFVGQVQNILEDLARELDNVVPMTSDKDL